MIEGSINLEKRGPVLIEKLIQGNVRVSDFIFIEVDTLKIKLTIKGIDFLDFHELKKSKMGLTFLEDNIYVQDMISKISNGTFANIVGR